MVLVHTNINTRIKMGWFFNSKPGSFGNDNHNIGMLLLSHVGKHE